MGTVWVAEQTEPVKRRVALKVIKPGMDSARVVARFEAERQALALMDHTNIAKVFDGGTTPAGRPYFVMELVKGVPITAYCDELHLSIRDRLGLFVQVCAAVQHAHQKGVIHRDLKPSNVLVAVQDGRPVPKVIDFGVAKAVGARLTDETMYTELGAVIGTLEYMAPEQAELSALDVDTRADVYALGVLLFELLTGTTPLTRSRLKAAGLAAMLRAIKEEEPPKPSTRLTESKDSLAGLAAARRTDPRRLAREVRGELDWIVLRALEKDRTRRYETANGLSRDVGRYLADEPVEAGPPSGWYRVRKFVRRNRGRVTAAATVLLAVLCGLAASLWQADRATRAERLAQSERAAAVDERDKADAARKDADEQRRVAERQAASAAIDLYAGTSSDASDDGRRAHLLLARLARTLPPHASNLREYITARLVYDIQWVTPLLRDGLDRGTLSPDGRYVLANAGEWRGLFEFPTGRLVTPLREGDERVWNGNFSSDGRLAYTITTDGVVRVWEVPSGRLRFRTPPHPTARGNADVYLGPNHLLVMPRVIEDIKGDEGPVLLWDISRGRLVDRLSSHTGRLYPVIFSPDGRAFVAGDQSRTARVWSTDDGHPLASLQLNDSVIHQLTFSPAGRRLLAVSGDDRWLASVVRWWDAGSWEPLGPPIRLVPGPPLVKLTFLGEDEVVISTAGALHLVRPSSVVAQVALDGLDHVIDPVNRLATDGRRLVRLDTGRVELPAPGRWYHPGAAPLALNGRWLPTLSNVVDLAVMKEVIAAHVSRDSGVTGVTSMPGGFAVQHIIGGISAGPDRYIPAPNAALPADLLERWAQVVLCGELGAGDEFVPWDEPTWERHWAELAAIPPLPDFPFPGQVATDRLYWLKRHYKQAESDPAKALPFLDRLIAAEPSREWYAARADVNVKLGRWAAAADDYLAGRTYPGPAVGEWVGQAGRPPEQYQAAVRLAEYARRTQPEVAEVATTLGIAYYRVGRDRDAVRLLTQANHLHRLPQHVRDFVGPLLLSPWAGLAADPATTDHYRNLAFLAMVHHRLGEAELAKARLAGLRDAARFERVGDDPNARSLLQEAEATLAAPPAPK